MSVMDGALSVPCAPSHLPRSTLSRVPQLVNEAGLLILGEGAVALPSQVTLNYRPHLSTRKAGPAAIIGQQTPLGLVGFAR